MASVARECAEWNDIWRSEIRERRLMDEAVKTRELYDMRDEDDASRAVNVIWR